MKHLDLTNLEKGAKAAVSSPRKTGFKDRARRGHFGDLRLLGLAGGIVLMCVLSFLLKSSEPPEAAPATPVEESAAFAPPILVEAVGEQDLLESGYGGLELDEPEAISTVRTPEQRERLLREMARNIPEGETLVW